MNGKTPDPELPPDADTGESHAGELADRRIGDFLIIRRLGSGGMADVYLAEQTSLSRPVALKILKSDSLVGSAEILLKRFEQEARAAAGLSHPNIVQVYMTGEEGPLRFIVQEYVAGLNLSQWIRKHGSPDYGTGLKWMSQIASAMRVAADAGIVHRDIKPENIMITREGVAKITDFGLARLAQQPEQKMNLTQVGTTMGTPWYMSPEQIQGSQLDHRSDQYSLGITCYQMFSGRPPFPGRNAVTVAVQHLKEDPGLLSSIRQDLPQRMCGAIHKMIAKRPEDRFQTFEELETELAQLQHIPVQTPSGRREGWWGKLQPFLPSRRAALMGGGLILVVSIAAGKRLHRPVELPKASQDIQVARESSAARQFAAAMLAGNRASSWQAVIDNYPDSAEADYARIRLGLVYMSPPLTNFSRAMEVFKEAEDVGKLAVEKTTLRILGLAGQAYVVSQRPQAGGERGSGREEGRAILQRAYDAFGEDVVDDTIRSGPPEFVEFFFNERGIIGGGRGRGSGGGRSGSGRPGDGRPRD
jgi:serine/threonine protein kinase